MVYMWEILLMECMIVGDLGWLEVFGIVNSGGIKIGVDVCL